MVTANWDQSVPYNNQCPTSGSSHAVTGCPATSLSMCYYRWKWPKTFPACARIPASSDYYGTYLEAPAIESRAADWDNIIDEYTGPSNYNSTSAQKEAVAWLMRYAGQTIPEYQYSTSASGATDPNILQGLKNMGYTDARLLTLTNGYAGSNQYYTDAQWNEWMLAELHAGRPIEYLASDRSAGGHAFNVFGCDTNGKYYVNWGWSGDSNGYCTLHNFTTATGSTGQSGSFVFNYGEAMIIGIEPPAGALGPQLNVNSTSVGFTTAGQQKIITLTGSNLTSDVTVALNDPSDAFSLSVAGLNNANINAIQPKSTGSVTIPKASISESTPVNIVVTLKAGVQSNASGTVTLSSNGADNVTVALSATLQEEETGGTASDAYLNIAKYATIDEAGWRNGYFNKLYAYTEDTDNEVAWLTLPIYGAWASWNYQKSNGQANGQGPQRWISSASISGDVNGSATWNQSSPFQGSSAYFTSTTAKYFGNTSTGASSLRTITFNVKNVTEVRVLGKNNSNNNLTGTRDKYRSQMVIYECQESNGTITPSSTAVTTQRGATGATANVTLSYSDLDAEKIYQVVVTTYRTQLYEICFKTPLAVPETPVIVSAEPTATTADITWVGGENNDSWNLRYRPYVEPEMETTFWDLNTNDQLTGWSIIDSDGDGNNWGYGQITEGDYVLVSESWTQESGAISPDNWLISPEITLGGTLKLNAWGIDENYYQEVFCVYVAPASAVGESTVDLTQFEAITPDITATASKTEYSFDLSRYSGQGVFAIRHYNCSDMNMLLIDDITVLSPTGSGSQPEWIYVNDVTSPYTIEGLTPETTYEVQVQGGNAYYGTSDWTASTIFTTLNGVGVPTIVSATPTATTSDIVWTAGEGNDGWNMRYRPYVEATTETILWDFPNDDAILDQQLEGWGINDADGDGNNWGLYYTDDSQTDLVWGSESYDGTNDLTPDNRLYTPNVTLGGTLKFKAAIGQANWPDKIGVYVIPDGEETAYFIQDVSPQAVMPSFAEYEIDLSQFEGTGQIIFRHYESDGNVAIFIDDIEVTYSSGTQPEWIYVYDVTSPYTITGLTPETTYEVQVQGVNDISTSAWTASTLFTTLAIEEQDLAYIEEHGVPGTTYRVSNELVAVDYAIVGDVVYLWCKDQGNASIAPAPAVGDKIDYLRNDQYAQAGRAWDESNWVVLKFTPGSVAEKVKSITDAVGHELNAGTITGVYSDAVNYTITMPSGEGMPAGAVGDEASYTPNVYCVANFNPANLTADGAQSNENGNVYFFMTPKVQEVCEITYAYWDATNFIVPTTSGFVGSLSLNWAYNADGDVTDDLNADNVYRFKTVVQRTGITMTPALKAEGGNYKVAPLNLTSASKADIPTAIGTVKAGVDVVDVYYVNSIGVMSKTPFHGVNVVVTRYSDGSRSSVKKVFK